MSAASVVASRDPSLTDKNDPSRAVENLPLHVSVEIAAERQRLRHPKRPPISCRASPAVPEAVSLEVFQSVDRFPLGQRTNTAPEL